MPERRPVATTRFTCATCRREHDVTEMAFGSAAPEQWHMISPAERERSTLSSDQCVLESSEGTSFYVRACLEIPIRGTDRHFEWGVWCSLSERSFDEMADHWTDPAREALGPYFGWLCTVIPTYPDTMFMKTHVRQRRVGVRPTVELARTDHPLAIDQREGIEVERLNRIVRGLLHRTERELP